MLRPAVVAGQFYPKDKKILEKTVDDLLAKAPTGKIPGSIIGIVVPHAGYPYSGLTAAYAYKAVADQDITTVIMLGPTHRVFIQGFAVYGQGTWETPLGKVTIDETIAHAIIEKHPKIKNLPEAHSEEHSLEVQIPFLQRNFKDFKIVPIMSLEPTWEECQILAQAIAHAVKNKKVLILASSDLYHGYSYDACKKTDALTLSYLEKFDPEGLYNALKQDKAQACGGYPIVILMLVCKLLTADKCQILHQTNSNDVMAEKGGYCVGYASAVFYKSESKSQIDTDIPSKAKHDKTTETKLTDTIQLTETEKKELLRIARATIENHITGKKIPEFKPLTEKLKEHYGVFVTLKKKGQLRGCIGYVQGIKPLYQAVSDMTIAASTEDPRFPRVSVDELKDLTIEITVMTPLRKIKNINEIQVGKHGLVIKRGYNQGLLLPQVATEENWDRETFLQHTCWKAGLPQDAWKDKETEIYIFSGTIFKEKE